MRHPSDLDQLVACQCFIDRAVTMEDHTGWSVTESCPFESTQHRSLDRYECRAHYWVKKANQPDWVSCGNDDVSTRFGHTSHFLNCQVRSCEPGNDTDCNH